MNRIFRETGNIVLGRECTELRARRAICLRKSDGGLDLADVMSNKRFWDYFEGRSSRNVFHVECGVLVGKWSK